MRAIKKFSLRLRSLFRKNRVEQELSDEIRFHLERLREQNVAKGMSHQEAHYAALRELGGIEQIKEECRDVRRVNAVETFLQDVRYGLRQLGRNPGFTVVAVLTLALGIGANTAIFSVVDAVLLRSLPVKKPNELVLLYGQAGTGRSSGAPIVGRWELVSFDAYQFFLRNNRSFQGLAAFRSGQDDVEVRWPGVESNQEPERAVSRLVSGNYFRVLGVDAFSGRALEPSDDTAGAHPVAVISYGYWEKKLKRNPSAIGRAVDLNGVPFTIVGVAPPDFSGERMWDHPPDYWIPLTFQPQIMRRDSFLTRKDEYWLNLIGRLKPGVTREQAQATMDLQLRQFLAAEVGAKPSKRDREAIQRAYIELAPGAGGISYLRQHYSEPLHLLIAIVALVLLVACANVANLLLARSSRRQKEMSMRLVTGATPSRLIRQMLAESLLLALLGAGAGLLLADWGVHALAALLSDQWNSLALNVTTNPQILAFTLFVSLLAGIVFGLAPALRASKTDMNQALKGETPRSGWSRSRLTPALVVLQVAVSLALLAAAGLLVRSLSNLENQNLGFNRSNVLLVQTSPRLAGIKNGDLQGLYQQLMNRLERLPGVRSCSIDYNSPMSGDHWHVVVTIQSNASHAYRHVRTNFNPVAPHYFETLGIPVLHGRPIEIQDTAKSPDVAVVNQAFARRYLQGQDPVGRRFWFGRDTSKPAVEIVALVKDARFDNPGEPPEPFVFVPLSQMPALFAGNIEVRTAGDAAQAAAEVRHAIYQVDSALPVISVKTLRRQIHDRLNQPRLVERLSALFGLLGLVLAAVGLYGVISYSAAQRTHEMGIRIALGASGSRILAAVVGEGVKMTLQGVVVGAIAGLALTRFLSSLLYGVKSYDPLTFFLSALVLTSVAFVASYIPARRASKVDPIVVLRYE